MKQLAGVLTILLLINVSTSRETLPSCDGIISQVGPCISYLIRTRDNPSNACCDGVQYLANFSHHKSDRRSICQCLEDYASSHSGINFSLVSTLPRKCDIKVKLPPISPTFDCSKA